MCWCVYICMYDYHIILYTHQHTHIMQYLIRHWRRLKFVWLCACVVGTVESMGAGVLVRVHGCVRARVRVYVSMHAWVRARGRERVLACVRAYVRVRACVSVLGCVRVGVYARMRFCIHVADCHRLLLFLFSV